MERQWAPSVIVTARFIIGVSVRMRMAAWFDGLTLLTWHKSRSCFPEVAGFHRQVRLHGRVRLNHYQDFAGFVSVRSPAVGPFQRLRRPDFFFQEGFFISAPDLGRVRGQGRLRIL